MGCGASSPVASEAQPEAKTAPGQASEKVPVSENVLPSVSQSPAPAAATVSPAGTPKAFCFGEQDPVSRLQPFGQPSALDTVNTFGEAAGEPESPIIKSTNLRKKRDELPDEGVPTIICEEDEEEAAVEAEQDRLAARQATPVQNQEPAAAAREARPEEEEEEEEDTGRPQRISQQTEIPAKQMEIPARGSPGPSPDTSANKQGWAGSKPAHSTSLSDSHDFEHLAPSGPFQGRAGRDQQNALASSEAKQPPIFPPLPTLGKPRPAAANRYDDITLSDDDDDDIEHGFDLERWLRYYKWNKTKPADLLEFLWRRFDPKHYSIYCATFKAQDSIFAGYQGENLAHGLCCRMEQLRVEIFGILNTLYDCSTGSYKVVGVFIFKGDEVPREFARMPDYEQLQMLKADTKDPAVRKFVGNLVTRCPPAPDLSVVCSQEFPWPEADKKGR